MASKLDLDRGVEIRFHPSNRMQVAMYVDSPGEYLTVGGERLDPKFARDAGFDVDHLARRKIANERLAAARRQIEAELRAEEDVIAQALSDKSNLDVRHVGGGQYALFSKKDGKQLTKVAMTKADIEMLIGAEVPIEPEAPPAELNTLLGS